jgi:hypothetical protein
MVTHKPLILVWLNEKDEGVEGDAGGYYCARKTNTSSTMKWIPHIPLHILLYDSRPTIAISPAPYNAQQPFANLVCSFTAD